MPMNSINAHGMKIVSHAKAQRIFFRVFRGLKYFYGKSQSMPALLSNTQGDRRMKDVVIVSACRTAIGAFGNSLKDMNGAILASITMKEAVRRANIDPALIDDCLLYTSPSPRDRTRSRMPSSA